ncbi:hypothetical protein SAV14893_092890 [Streptomyces avermitilis]|uniref:Uncharacterized protein n=1 Tax=Streptomyces avermitilis TaxID=33903 RepID=A0A4D4MDL1_STRAX|nr:hypothetical protein SAVMC3_03530 [Streptomyces avermitilis]GDY69896.1 hypothetical protein SAV14893_092890 [Streptomyces avermitilis]
MVGASGAADAQSSPGSVEVVQEQARQVFVREGVDGHEGDDQLASGVLDAGQETLEGVARQRGREPWSGGQGDVAGGVAEDLAFAAQRAKERPERGVDRMPAGGFGPIEDGGDVAAGDLPEVRDPLGCPGVQDRGLFA